MTTSPITSQLGTQQFLQLLVAQTQHQDPLQPTSNQDFLAQLAQFSSLGSLEELNDQFSSFASGQQLAQSATLLGHNATYGPTAAESGSVEGLRSGDSGVEALINSQWIPVDRVLSVLARPVS